MGWLSSFELQLIIFLEKVPPLKKMWHYWVLTKKLLRVYWPGMEDQRAAGQLVATKLVWGKGAPSTLPRFPPEDGEFWGNYTQKRFCVSVSERKRHTINFTLTAIRQIVYGISAFQIPQRVYPISHPCVIVPSESSHLNFYNSGPQVDRPRPKNMVARLHISRAKQHTSHRVQPSKPRQGTWGEQRCPIASSARSSTQLAHNLCKVAMTKTYMSVLLKCAFLAKGSKNMS